MSDTVKSNMPAQTVHAAEVIKRDDRLTELALEAIKSVLDAAGKYINVATYIRHACKRKTEPLDKKTVLFNLVSAGFAKSRASELWKVAQAPAEIWHRYVARVIGFNKTLSATRLLEMHTADGCGQPMLEAIKQAATDEAIEARDKAAPKKALSAKRKCQKAATRLSELMAVGHVRTPFVHVVGGFKVCVFDPDTKVGYGDIAPNVAGIPNGGLC